MKIPWNFHSELFLLVKIGEESVFATGLYKVTNISFPFPKIFYHYDWIENTSEINTTDTRKPRDVNYNIYIYFFLIDPPQC